MENFWQSLLAWLKERTASPLYITFVVAFIVWNWEVVYLLLWRGEIVSQSGLSTIVNSYQHWGMATLSDSFGTRILPLIDPLYHLLPPAALTYVSIVWLPCIANEAYEISRNHYESRFNIDAELKAKRAKKDADRAEEMRDDAKRRADAVTETKQSNETIKKVLTEEEKWDLEFEEIKPTKHYAYFRKLKNCIYEYHGSISNSNYVDYSEIIPFFHAHNIIEYDDKSKSSIDLTEKGKYFMKKYLSEQNNP